MTTEETTAATTTTTTTDNNKHQNVAFSASHLLTLHQTATQYQRPKLDSNLYVTSSCARIALANTIGGPAGQH
jgi:hypothetical protein